MIRTNTIPATEDAQWRPLYDAIKHMEHGELLTYDQLNSFSGMKVDGDDRWIIYSVDRELQISDHRALVNVRGVGYKIAKPEEHHGIVKARLKRSKRQVRKGILAGHATDLAKIEDPSAREAVIALTDHLRSVEARMRYQEKRLARAEARIDQVREEVADVNAAMESRVARLESLLSRVEKEDQS